MIPVTIVDVVKDVGRDSCAVLLFDEPNFRLLCIWVGLTEGGAVAFGIRDFALQRPLTHDFAANMLAAMGTNVEKVCVESLKEMTFYAAVTLRNGDDMHEVDARPSDALALAARVKCPIYVSEEVMQLGGVSIPERYRGATPSGKGIDAMIQGLDRQHGKTTEERLHELIGIAFGSES